MPSVLTGYSFVLLVHMDAICLSRMVLECTLYTADYTGTKGKIMENLRSGELGGHTTGQCCTSFIAAVVHFAGLLL